MTFLLPPGIKGLKTKNKQRATFRFLKDQFKNVTNQKVWCKIYHLICAVDALPIHDWSFKHVGEIETRPQVIRPDKINHAPVFNQVVL